LELDIVQYDLDEATKNRLENVIKNFLSKSGSMLAVLCDDAGRVLSYDSRVPLEEYKSEFITSIVSGIFGASLEMCKLLELEELELIQFEGRTLDVIIKHIKPRFLLGVLVKRTTSIGSVRLFLKEASLELEEILKEMKIIPKKTTKIDVETLEEKLREIIGGIE
jgi:predicted regulator of Ras-like GTPase activity (Roadblock/LC7/MglB family)